MKLSKWNISILFILSTSAIVEAAQKPCDGVLTSLEQAAARASTLSNEFFEGIGFLPDTRTRDVSKTGHSIYQRTIRFRDDPRFLDGLSPKVRALLEFHRVRGQSFTKIPSGERDKLIGFIHRIFSNLAWNGTGRPDGYNPAVVENRDTMLEIAARLDGAIIELGQGLRRADLYRPEVMARLDSQERQILWGLLQWTRGYSSPWRTGRSPTIMDTSEKVEAFYRERGRLPYSRSGGGRSNDEIALATSFVEAASDPQNWTSFTFEMFGFAAHQLIQISHEADVRRVEFLIQSEASQSETP